MQYLISFLEGLITFISPCLLPLLPVYLSYFAGAAAGRADGKNRTLYSALGFVLGFTIVFVLLGAFAGSLGFMLRRHATAVNIVSGFVVVLFGLNYLGLWRIPILNNVYKKKFLPVNGSVFFSSVLFGCVFSIGWTPCVGAFLGSALLLASQQGSAMQGIFMLLCYSLGLGIPFVASAVLIERFKETFQWIKRHYDDINKISGLLLVVLGILMMTGTMGYLIGFLAD